MLSLVFILLFSANIINDRKKDFAFRTVTK